MGKKFVLAACLAGWFVLSPLAANGHPFHVSIAEAEYNDERKSLEIALRVHVEDLEQMLRGRLKKPVDFDQTAIVDPAIHQYLQRTFQVKDADGKAAPIRWIGYEIEKDSAWLYFEAKLTGSIHGAAISNRIFFEQQPDQLNSMTLKLGRKHLTLRFTKEKATQVTPFGVR